MFNPWLVFFKRTAFRFISCAQRNSILNVVSIYLSYHTYISLSLFLSTGPEGSKVCNLRNDLPVTGLVILAVTNDHPTTTTHRPTHAVSPNLCHFTAFRYLFFLQLIILCKNRPADLKILILKIEQTERHFYLLRQIFGRKCFPPNTTTYFYIKTRPVIARSLRICRHFIPKGFKILKQRAKQHQ